MVISIQMIDTVAHTRHHINMVKAFLYLPRSTELLY